MDRVSLQTVHRHVLVKQHLTAESKADDVVQVVCDVCGLHATSPTTPYLSLLARMGRFTRRDLDKELYEKGSLGKIRCVRRTIHILPKELIPAAHAATRALRVPTEKQFSRYVGVTEEEYRRTRESVLELLEGKRMTVKEIKEAIETDANVSAVVNLMCDEGLLLRTAPEKGWRSNLHTYRLFSELFPDVDLDSLDEAEARAAIVELYISCYGPVTEKDVAWWTGFPKREVHRILKGLEDRTVPLEIEDIPGTFVMFEEDRESLGSSRGGKSEKGLTVNLLPSLDPYLMGWKDRERYLDPKHRDFVFDRSGNATSTILVDGRVAGVWDYETGKNPALKLFLFRRLDGESEDRLEAAAVRTGVFVAGGADIEVKHCGSMTPLPERTAGAVVHPLGEH